MRKRGMAREQPFSCSGKEVKTDSVRACVCARERVRASGLLLWAPAGVASTSAATVAHQYLSIERKKLFKITFQKEM